MPVHRLTEAEANELISCGEKLVLSPGEDIYRKGDSAKYTYYISKGCVRIWDNIRSGREMTLDVLETGHIFGESASVDNSVYPVNATAVSTVTLICFQLPALFEKCQIPQLGLHMLQLTSDSMNRLTNRVEEQFVLDRFGKTASYLLDITAVESADKGTIGGTVPFTHSELSYALGLNRTTVSEALKYFDQKKWISCGYGTIQILNSEKLRAFVEAQMG